MVGGRTRMHEMQRVYTMVRLVYFSDGSAHKTLD